MPKGHSQMDNPEKLRLHKTKNTQLGKFALLDNVAHQLLKINVLVII